MRRGNGGSVLSGFVLGLAFVLLLVATGALLFIGYNQLGMNRYQARMQFFDEVTASRSALREEQDRIRENARFILSFLQRKKSTFNWCNQLHSFDQRCFDIKAKLVSREEGIADGIRFVATKYFFIRAQLAASAARLDLNGWEELVAREGAVLEWRDSMEKRVARVKEAIQVWARKGGRPEQRDGELIESTRGFARAIIANPIPYWDALNALGRSNKRAASSRVIPGTG
ncbi:hypothetical protein [Thiohalorhabdus methylotrophus]|uniref:Uncharacterized protein n=1 Tax=Thiohalorhabdus methylotrophus TaxID=3242694 RepID=A0ABV4TYW0_9GAMM